MVFFALLWLCPEGDKVTMAEVLAEMVAREYDRQRDRSDAE